MRKFLDSESPERGAFVCCSQRRNRFETASASSSILNSPLIHRIAGRPVQNDEMQGAGILKNEAYIRYAAKTPVCVGRTGRQDEAQHSSSCL